MGLHNFIFFKFYCFDIFFIKCLHFFFLRYFCVLYIPNVFFVILFFFGVCVCVCLMQFLVVYIYCLIFSAFAPFRSICFLLFCFFVFNVVGYWFHKYAFGPVLFRISLDESFWVNCNKRINSIQFSSV